MTTIDKIAGTDAGTISEVTRVLGIEAQAILNCVERIKNEPARGDIHKALQLLQSSLSRGGKIVVTGVGKSGKIAQKIAATLSSTGSLAIFLHPTEGLHGDLGAVSPNDAVIALSYTGNTEELVKLIPSLKSLRVPIIGMGGNRKSQLAEKCDAWVDAMVEQEACPHNLAPTASTTLALALGDALAVTLMQLRGFDAKAFAQNHPGGSLGKRLNLSVADLMHSTAGDQPPIVGEHATMDEVVVTLTRTRLSAVLVTQGTKLLGIITDGDVRKSLKHREKFFDLKASEVMTRNPVVALPEMLAHDALQLMENRPNQLSALPVVDPSGKCVGIIRIHDLVRSF